MIKCISLLLLVFLSLGCSSRKKSIDNVVLKSDSVEYHRNQDIKENRYIDTTQTRSGRVVITEIDFFSSDSIGGGLIETISINTSGDFGISGIRGSRIKSIRQTSIEEKTKNKGEHQESKESKEQLQAVSTRETTSKQNKQISPAPDPYKWRYIFYLSLVLLTGILYLKRIPIINWIKKILSGLVKR